MASFDFSSAGTGAGGLVGLAGGIYSAIQGSNIAKEEAGVTKAEIGTEEGMESTKLQATYLSAQRQQLQNIRNEQMARSMALSTASGQGAQFSSGLAGAYGGIAGQAGTNALGISQNLQIGQQMFNQNQELSAEKMTMAGLQSEAATNSAMGGVFGSLSKLGGPIGSLVGMIPFGP